MEISFSKHTEQMLYLAKSIIKTSPLLIDETGTINVKGDRTIGMDLKIEKAIINYIKKNNIPSNIFSEEIGMIKFHPHPQYLIAFDPLDGSTNYKIGKNIYPYGFLIAIYKGTEPRLKDVIASGAIEFTRNLSWIFQNNRTKDINGKLVKLKSDWSITKSAPVYLDLYYKGGYEKYRPLAQKVFIRNMGSTIGNLSYVLLNIAAGLGGVCMRPEEIGAVYSLIKGAGGIVVNHKGEDIGNLDFSSKNTYQTLAGCKNLVNFIVNQLK